MFLHQSLKTTRNAAGGIICDGDRNATFCGNGISEETRTNPAACGDDALAQQVSSKIWRNLTHHQSGGVGKPSEVSFQHRIKFRNRQRQNSWKPVVKRSPLNFDYLIL